MIAYRDIRVLNIRIISSKGTAWLFREFGRDVLFVQGSLDVQGYLKAYYIYSTVLGKITLK